MNIFKTTFLAALSIFFIGCSSTPQSSVEDMYEALKDGDAAGLYRVTTEPKARQLTVHALKRCSVDKPSYKDNFKLAKDCFREMYGNIIVKKIEITKVSNTKAKAIVSLENNSKSTTNTEYIHNINGKWLVSRYP